MRHHVVITYQLGCQVVKVDDRLLLIDGCASRWRALWDGPGVSTLFSSWFIGMNAYVQMALVRFLELLFGDAVFLLFAGWEGVWWRYGGWGAGGRA